MKRDPSPVQLAPQAISLDVLRENPKLRKLFDEKYC